MTNTKENNMDEKHKNTMLSIWTTKEFAAKFNRATDEDAQLSVITEIMDKAKHSMTSDLEALEDDALQFKAIMLSYKKAYKQVLDEQADATYKLWEEVDAKFPSLRAKIKTFTDAIEPINESTDFMMKLLERVSNKMETINTYQLEKMVSLIKTIQECDEETKNILIKVLNK